MRTLLLALLASPLAPTPAAAADRTVGIASFDRVRIDAPVEVRIVTGSSPTARLSGEEAALDALDLRLNGTTLVVRRRTDRWQEQPRGTATRPVVVALGTVSLAGVAVIGAGQVTVDRMKGDRVDLSVGGPGTIAVGAVEADQAHATIIGGGTVTLSGGRARTARLLTNGPGTIDAAGVDAGELVVRLDGPGETRARARYNANVTSTGIGRVTIAGTPKCQVRADAGGPVTCGTSPVRPE